MSKSAGYAVDSYNKEFMSIIYHIYMVLVTLTKAEIHNYILRIA